MLFETNFIFMLFETNFVFMLFAFMLFGNSPFLWKTQKINYLWPLIPQRIIFAVPLTTVHIQQ